MSRPPMRRVGRVAVLPATLRAILPATLVAAACLLASCAHGPASPAAPAPTTCAEDLVPWPLERLSLPEGSWLDAPDEGRLCALRDALTDVLDPCTPRLDLLAGLGQLRLCYRTKDLARAAVALAGQGESPRVIALELYRRLERSERDAAKLDLEGAPMWGSPGARHVVVEFMDFECPACRAARTRVKALVGSHDVVLYIKHWPTRFDHVFARYASLASMAAHRQGLFWPVSEGLFARQDALSEAAIDRIVQAAGADMERYRADMASAALSERVDRDVRDGEAAGVKGTPWFYLDGREVSGVDELEQRVEGDE